MGAMNTPPHPKAQAKFRQGLALHEKGQLAQAMTHYQAALQLDAHHAESIHHLGIIALQNNDFLTAIDYFERAIALEPHNPASLNNLGMALEDIQQPESALHAYERALSCDKNHFEAQINRGNVLQTLKRWDQALQCYEALIASAPRNPDAYNNKGNVLRALKRYDEALKCFDQAIALKPDYAQAWNNRAIALKDLKQFEQALQSLTRAIELAPNYADAYSNRGLTLKELKQFELALKNLDQAIALNPNFAQAYGNRGGLYQEMKRYEQAYQDYDRAISINPSISALHGKRLHTQMHLCDWSDLSARIQYIKSAIEAGEPAADPFTVLGVIDLPAIQKKAAEICVEFDYPSMVKPCDISIRPKNNKIRLAYFSADFRNHPVSYLMAELFETHDKNIFELIGFSIGEPVHDAMQNRVSAAFDMFYELGHQTDQEIAQRARALNIDIAIDLGGFTIDNRPGIFACRAAPVQVGYIGYLGSMGASYYDYIIADHTLITEKSRAFYSERIIYLPSYQANDTQRHIAEKIFSRAELNLPQKGFVFCCFNNNYKFTPATFDSWMRILNAVPDSVLYLYADHALVQSNLIKEAMKRGIDASRLIFGRSLPREQYLARYKSIDLFLDTLPYNAGTTASDALWAGLPVLTCAGHSLASRMAASLLTAIELPELITQSQAEYESMAISLATDPDQYRMIKNKLAMNIHTTALFNSEQFRLNIEKAFIKINMLNLQGIATTDIG